MEDQTGHHIPLGQSINPSVTLNCLNSLKSEGGEDAAEDELAAGRGWFVRYKERRCPRDIKVQGNLQVLMEKLQPVTQEMQLMNEGGYTTQQGFSVEETAFCWKKTPSRTCIAGEEKSTPGFKVSKHRLPHL